MPEHVNKIVTFTLFLAHINEYIYNKYMIGRSCFEIRH